MEGRAYEIVKMGGQVRGSCFFAAEGIFGECAFRDGFVALKVGNSDGYGTASANKTAELYYGILLIIEKVILLKLLKKAPAVLGHVYTMVIVMLGWALFYFEDTGALFAFFGRAFSAGETATEGLNAILGYLPLLLISILAATPLGSRIYQKLKETRWADYAMIPVGAVILILCVAALASQSYNPFIYFRF